MIDVGGGSTLIIVHRNTVSPTTGFPLSTDRCYMAESTSIFSLELWGKGVHTSHFSAEVASTISLQILKEAIQCKDCFRGLIQEVGSNTCLMQQVGGSSVPHASALKMLMLSNSTQK